MPHAKAKREWILWYVGQSPNLGINGFIVIVYFWLEDLPQSYEGSKGTQKYR